MYRCITTALAVLLSQALTFHCHAGLEGDVEQLKVVAEAHKANREKITTWQGNAEVVTRRGEEEHRRLVEFAWDARTDSHFWRWSPDPDADAEEVVWFQRHSENGMIHDGQISLFRQMFPNPKYKRLGGDPALHLIIKERRGGGWGDRGNREFHAREHLDFHGTPTSYEWLMEYYREADNRLLEGSVSREDDRVTFERVSAQMTCRYVFDLSKGGNLVEFTQRVMLVNLLKSRAHIAYDWEEVDGISVPKSFASQGYRSDKPLKTMKVKWTRNVLNKPIPEGTFTVENIGILPGDRVIDQITDTKSIYKADELP